MKNAGLVIDGIEHAVDIEFQTVLPQQVDAPDDESEVGAEATVVERLSQRTLTDSDDAALDRLRREAARALPRRTSYRRRSVRKGDRLDMRRTLREAARRDGDDYLLSGEKLWISNSAEAGVFLVMANAAPEKGHRGITCFVVPREAAGLRVGPKEDKLGTRASSRRRLLP